MIQAALAKYLDSIGLGVHDGTTNTTLFLEKLPPTPVNAAAIGTKTAPPGDFSGDRVSGIHIIVRRDKSSGKARTGYEAARAIQDALHGLRHITLDPGGDDEVRLVSCRADAPEPVDLGEDANGHPRWSCRFLVETVAVTAHTIL